ncbi:hypothetical protein EAI_14289 [Harpegnathos saltator]|uniref:Uncharacterized protein n=1 Tax=Harpegnathos saltator TaxID=610380 RepID=E2BRH0_HARSA|nr:hypothetical protein EAI_14289 [Harpegnathos saltator]
MNTGVSLLLEDLFGPECTFRPGTPLAVPRIASSSQQSSPARLPRDRVPEAEPLETPLSPGRRCCHMLETSPIRLEARSHPLTVATTLHRAESSS